MTRIHFLRAVAGGVAATIAIEAGPPGEKRERFVLEVHGLV